MKRIKQKKKNHKGQKWRVHKDKSEGKHLRFYGEDDMDQSRGVIGPIKGRM